MSRQIKKLNDKSLLFGVIIAILMIGFIWAFSYINEPIGDDVAGYFDGTLSAYLDECPYELGKRFTNPIQVLRTLKFTYLNWSGRMTGYAVLLFGRIIFPKSLQALVTALIFVTNILLTMRIAYGSMKEALRSPVVLGLIFMAVYWYRIQCFFEYMWTMVSVYSVPTFLVLLYYNLNRAGYGSGSDSRQRMVLFQVLGFLSGFSHEVLSLMLIIAVGTEFFRDLAGGKCEFTDVFRHTGLGVGYIFCFMAPGNFHRTTQSHDATSASFGERLINLMWQKKSILFGTREATVIFCVFAFAALLAFIVMTIRKADIKQFLLDRLGIIAAIVLSVFICAAMPHYPVYGEDLWIFMVYAVCLSFIVRLSDYVNMSAIIQIVATVLAMGVFFFTNLDELRSYASTSYDRRSLVRQAVSEARDEVMVPRFRDDLSPERYLIYNLNSQDQYDRDYFTEYYGIRLVIEEPGND